MIQQLANFDQYAQAVSTGVVASGNFEGVCLACTIEWLRLCFGQYKSMQESDARARMGLLASSFQTIVANHGTYTAFNKAAATTTNKVHYQDRVNISINILGGGGNADSVRAIDDAMGDHRFNVEGTATHQKSDLTAWKAFADALFAPGAGHVLVFKVVDSAKKKGYHGVGTYGTVRGNKKCIYLFDPNVGEHLVDTNGFRAAVEGVQNVLGLGGLHTLRKFEVGAGNNFPTLPGNVAAIDPPNAPLLSPAPKTESTCCIII
jgi:Yersinia/Haemophilus virulence surface antigen